MSAAIESLAKEPIVGTAPRTEPEEALKNIVTQQLIPYVGGIMDQISCELERRKVAQKKEAMEIGHSISFTGGHNARLNLNSVDQSTNVVSISEENFFAQVRDVIKNDVRTDEQAELLKRLGALEAAANTPTAMERYHQFVARAADYASLLPLLPRLLEIAKQVAQGV